MGSLFEKPAFLLLLLFFVIPMALLIWLVVFLSRRSRQHRTTLHLPFATADKHLQQQRQLDWCPVLQHLADSHTARAMADG